MVKFLFVGDLHLRGTNPRNRIDDYKEVAKQKLIGNLTSQLLANVYLNELDQFCKKVLGTKFYIRYMDDVIILSQSKEELHEIKERISKFLDEELQLTLNKKTCIRPVSMGIQFVGLHIWSTHRTVRKSTSLRIKRRLKAAAKQYVAGNLTYERYGEICRNVRRNWKPAVTISLTYRTR